ncbi:hypothetical protein GCM10020331_003270 [Ectobacillus funiculus]
MSVDGHHVELAANIGTPEDVNGVLENGGEGVGLYRTEFFCTWDVTVFQPKKNSLRLIKQYWSV